MIQQKQLMTIQMYNNKKLTNMQPLINYRDLKLDKTLTVNTRGSKLAVPNDNFMIENPFLPVIVLI